MDDHSDVDQPVECELDPEATPTDVGTEILPERSLFPESSPDPWNAGTNERTGNTVSIWPGDRPFDNGTWEPVKEK